MRYALITGGLGFIGSHIARNLLSKDLVDRVVLVDHYGSFVSPVHDGFVDRRRQRLAGIEDHCIIERAQVQHFGVLTRILSRYRPLYIFHLAAMPLASLQNSSAEESVEGTVTSTNNLLTICTLLRDQDGYTPDRFVYASSSMVYGDFRYTPADEMHPLEPRNIYGTMKLAGEVCTLGLARSFGLKAAVVRPSAVYGPTDMNRRVTQVFIDNAVKGETLVVHGRDDALDFTYVEDVADGFVLAATKDEAVGEVFNVTAGRAYTLVEYAEVLKRYFPKLTYEVVERDDARPKRGTLSIDKARQMLGYQPRHTLEEGLCKYIAFRHGAVVRAREPVGAAG
jgi:nucleoside-diphosphate-sugar epimerase